MGREVKDNKKMDFRSYRSGVRKFVKGIENAVIELSKVSKTLVGDSEIEKTQKRFLLEEKKRELWKGVPYEKGLLYTLEITHKCFLECGHRFAEASPSNNDFIDKEVVEKLA